MKSIAFLFRAMMCISKAPRVYVICLVFSYLPHFINGQHAEHGQTTLPNQKHEAEDYNKTFNTLGYTLERRKLSAEKRQFFISKLFEKYGTVDILPFEGFEHMLAHIRLGNLSFPDHDLTFHRFNSSTNFISIHSNHIHIPDLSNRKPCNRSLPETDDDYPLSRHIHKENATENKTQKFSQQGEKAPISQLEGSSLMDSSSEVQHLEYHQNMDKERHNRSDVLPDILGDHDENHLHGQGKKDIGENDHHTRKLGENNADEEKCLTPQEILKSFSFGTEDEITMSDFVDICPALIYHLDKQQCLDFTMVTSIDKEGHEEETKQKDGTSKNTYQISAIPAKVWGYSCLAVVIVSVVGLLGVAVIPLINKLIYNHLLNFLVALAVGALAGDALLHLLPHALQIVDEGHSHGGKDSHDVGGIMKGLCGLGGIYFFFFIESILTILTEFKRQQKKKKRQSAQVKDTYDGSSLPKEFREISAVAEKESMISIQDTTDKKSSSSSHQKHSHAEETINMMDQLEFSHSHSHSHSHHGDRVPNSVSAIVWMVILGDGLHNLSDGLAIGAAFGASLSSGFSTSIAVFCHELPHEIGDFAMLLKSGMTVKQAIFYNVISSVLSFVGMVIGVMLGNVTSASLWIFSVVAGMFLYIALVNMLPEIKNNGHEGMVWKQLFDLILQSAGMFVGAGIMLSIALFEDKIQIAFEPV